MAKTLKEKTIWALIWNVLDKVGQQIILFLVGIMVARILSTEDYALVGMLSIFTALANIVIESGFSTALIRKKDATSTDYSSVFYFNMGASIVVYLLLFLCAPLIAAFFKQPSLTLIARIVFLAIPINSVSIIQGTILTKQINFKKLTKVNFISLLGSGLLSLYMAYSWLWRVDISCATSISGYYPFHSSLDNESLAPHLGVQLSIHKGTVCFRLKSNAFLHHQYRFSQHLLRFHR